MDELDLAWFSANLGEELVSVRWMDMECQGGLVSSMKKMNLLTKGGVEKEFVIKLLGAGDENVKFSREYGWAREADFYNFIFKIKNERGKSLRSFLPQVIYARSDWESGEKKIIMENLSTRGTVANVFNGLHWGIDTSKCPQVDPVVVTRVCFTSIARLHASFWNSRDLATMLWLQGSQWPLKEGRAEWENCFGEAKSGDLVHCHYDS